MDLREAVTAKIADSGEAVASRVVDFLAEATIAKRVNQVVSAYTEIDNLTRDFRRAKPDLVAFDGAGLQISANYSKQALDARNKIAARMEKVTKALDLALEKNDFSGLNNLGGNKPDAETE